MDFRPFEDPLLKKVFQPEKKSILPSFLNVSALKDDWPATRLKKDSMKSDQSKELKTSMTISPPMNFKASILAVGTELTTGQVTNRNAPWIAEKLVDFGLEVVLHETVADDRAHIVLALNRCA